MKTTLMLLGILMGVAGPGLAGPEKPGPEADGIPEKVDRGLYVFPDEDKLSIAELEALMEGRREDPLLRKLMAEMLEELDQDKEKLEAPVEFPTLDAPEFQRLLRGTPEPVTRQAKRWTIGVVIAGGDADGIVVDKVMDGSPAEKSGVQPGDVLVDVNGIVLRDFQMLADLLQVVRDQEVVLGVRRGEEDVKVKITARESEPPGRDLFQQERPWLDQAPKIEVKPEKESHEDEVLNELRGMRGLMEEMLQELKKQKPAVAPRPSRVRQVPTPPRN